VLTDDAKAGSGRPAPMPCPIKLGVDGGVEPAAAQDVIGGRPRAVPDPGGHKDHPGESSLPTSHLTSPLKPLFD